METRSDYCCKDCYFFDEGMCKADAGEYRYATKENEACLEFEFKKIKV